MNKTVNIVARSKINYNFTLVILPLLCLETIFQYTYVYNIIKDAPKLAHDLNSSPFVQSSVGDPKKLRIRQLTRFKVSKNGALYDRTTYLHPQERRLRWFGRVKLRPQNYVGCYISPWNETFRTPKEALVGCLDAGYESQWSNHRGR